MFCLNVCMHVRMCVPTHACMYVSMYVGPYVCLGAFDIVLANQGVICLGLGVGPTLLHNSTLC